MADLPTIANSVPQVRAPESRISPSQIASPYLHLAETLSIAAKGAEDFAKQQAKSFGLQAVTRDEEGNVQVEGAPIIGAAADYYKQGVQVAAVADAENVVKTDLLKMRHEFKDDPAGFLKAADTYGKEKTAQYKNAAGPEVGITVGRLVNNTTREFHEGLLNHK